MVSEIEPSNIKMTIKNSKFWILICNLDFCILLFAFKKYLHFLVLLAATLTMSGCGTLARYREIKPVIAEGEEVEIMELEKPRPALRAGEKLTYEVYWLKIPVGIATAEVKDIVEINGRQAYHLVGTARSNRWLNLVFKVDDYVESYLDKETLLSLKYIARRNEGRYHADMTFDYDWQERQLKFENKVDGTKTTFPLPGDAVDEFSAFYYFRLKEISQDKPLTFIVNQAEKNWQVKIGITSMGKMNLPGVGVFDAFMVEPVPHLEEKPLEKGKAWVWLSNDERRIPLMIKMRVDIPFLGTIVAVLQKIE